MSNNNTPKTSVLHILSGTPGFDPKTFEVLAMETSDEVAESILHEFRNTLCEIRALLQEILVHVPPDTEAVGKIAHRVKGSAHLVGMLKLADVSEKLLFATKKSEAKKWQDLIRDFQEECEFIENQLNRIF